MFYIDAQHDTWLLVDNHTTQWTQLLKTAGTSLGTSTSKPYDTPGGQLRNVWT